MQRDRLLIDEVINAAERRRHRSLDDAGTRPAACAQPDSALHAWQNGGVDSDAVLVIGGRQVDRASVAEICSRFGLKELAVFGSVARGEESPDSDVDLLYVAGPDARLGFAINRLEDELEALFGRPVDLVSRNALHRLIRDRVEREARPLYAA